MTGGGSTYRAPALDWRAKGLPALEEPLDPTAVADAGWSLFDGRLLLPTMVIRRDALEHDIALLAQTARERGVSLAPHGKTTMSPQIWQAQLDAGAWAITVATAWQARVAVHVGVPRILIANEVVDRAGLAWLGALLDADGPEVLCQADSVDAVAHMDAALGRRARRLHMLVEVGLPGGRAGAREQDDAIAVARAIAAAPALALTGATAFEGIVAGATRAERTSAAADFISRVVDVAGSIEELAVGDGASEMILSGGGSVHFLTVMEILGAASFERLPSRVVIRSGCTVTHDHGGYDLDSPWGSGAGPDAPRLQPALEVWAPVLSCPEPGSVIAGAGKRDLPYDAAMPTPIKRRAAHSEVTEPLSGVTVARLNDQHAYLETNDVARLGVGDLVGFGIAHPCSAFDRWRAIPVVDADDDIVAVYETIF